MSQPRGKGSNPTSSVRRAFRDKLLKWFDQNRRDLPWRRKMTPYSVWISEVMLQQTVVKAVIPYYEQWMKRFPNVNSLARASAMEVTRMWEGLGYYARARNLQSTAQIVITKHGGRIPDRYEELITLPGIGRYTAAAILSIAYGQPYPVLDANVRRVMVRFLGLKNWNVRTERRVKSVLEEVIPHDVPGRFNEALMELGQTVCLVKLPRCSACPLRSLCRFHCAGGEIAIRSGRSVDKKRFASAVLLIRRGKKLLLSRKEEGALKGLHLPPKLEGAGGITGKVERSLQESFGDRYQFIAGLKPRTHTYTRHVERLYPLLYRVRGGNKRLPGDFKWVELSRLDEIAFPSVYRKILTDMMVQEGHRCG